MRIIYITTRNVGEAKKIANHLLSKKLIACANMFPIESMYSFEGDLQEDIEFVILIKTKKENYEIVQKEIEKMHSYETPAIFSWVPDKVNKKYNDWINNNCN